MKRPKAAHTDEQADEEPVYAARSLPPETTEQWVESCKPLRARESRIILRWSLSDLRERIDNAKR
jgi:hypothetical protein